MADDSDFTVPCSCGGYVHFIEGIVQPHTHTGTTNTRDTLEKVQAFLALELRIPSEPDDPEAAGMDKAYRSVLEVIKHPELTGFDGYPAGWNQELKDIVQFEIDRVVRERESLDQLFHDHASDSNETDPDQSSDE
jgi:hypothetical protein